MPSGVTGYRLRSDSRLKPISVFGGSVTFSTTIAFRRRVPQPMLEPFSITEFSMSHPFAIRTPAKMTELTTLQETSRAPSATLECVEQRECWIMRGPDRERIEADGPAYGSK